MIAFMTHSEHQYFFYAFRKLAERLKQVDYEETETEAIMQTAKEAEDKWEAEDAGFTPASRITGWRLVYQKSIYLNSIKWHLTFFHLARG